MDQNPSPIKKWSGLCFFLALSFLVQFFAAQWTFSALEIWYAGLNKPGWNPPNIVFGPVWTVLYLMMAVSAWRVWLKTFAYPKARFPLFIYGVQLFLNFLWSGFFFALQNPEWAFYDISLLWIFITLTLFLFIRTDLTAGILLLPYWLWVLFAAALNFSIWKLNS